QEWVIREQLPRYIHAHLGQNLFVFTAKDNGAIIATAWLVVVEKPAGPKFPSGRTGTVMSVYTREAYRRQGIAQTLMQELLAFAKEQGLDCVELKATKYGYPLYKKLGFHESAAAYTPMQYDF
ncbi:MAG: GNAT family N-acetyltransferase, partial [Eubacteriales bacterium]|nr:GNAT family N-acetyltransferase [Eubacteriales bacterium]